MSSARFSGRNTFSGDKRLNVGLVHDSWCRVLLVLSLAQFIASCSGVGHAKPSCGAGANYFRKTATNTSLIIFVHGVTGDSKETWTHKNGSFWPAIITKDDELKDFDIFLFDYCSRKFGISPTTHDIAEELNRELVQQQVYTTYSDLFLIGHSLGGLVIRNLVSSVLAYQHDELRRIRTSILISSPWDGHSLAAVINHLSANKQFADLREVQENSYLQQLNRTWTQFLNSVEPARQWLFIKAACERLETQIGFSKMLIVPEGSAIASAGNYDCFQEDHISIAKPAKDDAPVYLWVKNELNDRLPINQIVRRLKIPTGSLDQALNDLQRVIYTIKLQLDADLTAQPPMLTGIEIERQRLWEVLNHLATVTRTTYQREGNRLVFSRKK